MTSQRTALLIATDRFDDPAFTHLRAPADDAASLGAVLADKQVGGFDVQPVLHNRPSHEVSRSIESFFLSADRDDLLLLYVSGHGRVSEDRRLHFITIDTESRLLAATSVDDYFINRAMHRSPARSIVLVLDCCQSGAFGRGLVRKGTAEVDIPQRFLEEGRAILTASNEFEDAFEELVADTDEPPRASSVFTQLLVEGLRTGHADLDGDGEISIAELHRYVLRRARGRSLVQTPGLWSEVHGDLIVARSPRRRRRTRKPARPPLVPQAVALIRRGTAHHHARRFGEAEDCFSAAIDLEPDALDALLGRGAARLGQHDFVDALEDFDRALRDDEQCVPALVGRAIALTEQGQFDEALSALDRALAIEPDSLQARVAHARVLLRREPPRAEAAAELAWALDIDPEDAEAHALMGLSCLSAGRPADAHGHFEAALEHDPECVEALVGLADAGGRRRVGPFSRLFKEWLWEPVYLGMSRETPDKVLAQAAEIDPESPVVLRFTARWHLERAEHEDASAALENVLARNPRDWEALQLRAHLHAAQGLDERARADFDAALAIVPEYAAALAGRATLSRHERDASAVVAGLQRAFALDPTVRGSPVRPAELHCQLASALVECGDLDEADSEFTITLDETPEDLTALMGRSAVRLAIGRPAAALADVEAALAAEPASHDVKDAYRRTLVSTVRATAAARREANELRSAGIRNVRRVTSAAESNGWGTTQVAGVIRTVAGDEEPMWLFRAESVTSDKPVLGILITSRRIIAAHRNESVYEMVWADVEESSASTARYRLADAEGNHFNFDSPRNGVDVTGLGLSANERAELAALISELVAQARANLG